jgi:hypothetical protein
MTTTANISITLLEAAQAQKEVTINEALKRVDALLNNAVLDRGLATPPGSPAEGDMYIVAPSATGAWASKDGQIAYFDQVWKFIPPSAGSVLMVNDEATQYYHDGTGWRSLFNAQHTNLGDKNASFTISRNDGAYQRARFTGNITTLTLPALPAVGSSFSLTLEIAQDGTGSRTVGSWAVSGGGSVIWKGADSTLSTAANSVDVICLTATSLGYRAELTKGYA